MKSQALHYLTSLVSAHSPTGHEKAAAEIYRAYVGAFADEVLTDIHGNVTAVLNPQAKVRIMLSAHMDEIGFIVHYIDDQGLLRFSPVGGHDGPVPVGQMVWVHGRQRMAGAIGRKAIHLQGPEEKSRKPSISELWVDIGATSRAEAEEVVRKGDYITYQHEFSKLLGDNAMGRGFDNKAGLFIASEALRQLEEDGGLHPDVGVHVLGTVQEEIGSRGAQTAADKIAPLTALAIDMEQAIDYPGISQAEHGDLALGRGPTVSKGPNTNPRVFDLLMAAATDEGIGLQVQVAPSATPTDQKALQTSSGGVATGLVGVALRYMHTPCEVINLADVEACARLTAAYCRRVKPGIDFTPY